MSGFGSFSHTSHLSLLEQPMTYLDVETLEAAPGVMTLTVPSVTRSLCLALVNILTGPPVGRDPREDEMSQNSLRSKISYWYPLGQVHL